MREVLEIKRDSEYFTAEGLRTLTGLTERMWHYAIFKEVLDNALDAVDSLSKKTVIVNIDITDEIFEVMDAGGGIPEETLDSIHDYSVYASNKREFRTPTRGFQGNALKTVVAICYLNNYKLEFLHGGKSYSYKLDQMKLQAGIIEFHKEINTTDRSDDCGGVRVTGIDYSSFNMEGWLYEYYSCNPDVEFIYNGQVHPALTEAKERTEKTYIHWYDFPKFNQLLQAIAYKDPDRTVKQFCNTFAGTQRIISKLELKYNFLSEVSNDERSIRYLFDQLMGLVKPVKPSTLEKHTSGKDALFSIYSDNDPDSEFKYKMISGEYEYGEAKIPYVLEGFLFQSKSDDERVKMFTGVNNSVPYESIPFYCSFQEYKFCKKAFGTDSIRGLLDQAGLNEASGLVFFINYVSPFVEFTDKAKTRINADPYMGDMLKLLTTLCKDTVKEVEKARRARRSFNRKSAITPEQRSSKKDLMHEYFSRGYEMASGDGVYLTKARQVFYAIREMINLDYGVELKLSDYNTFTQDVLTQKIKEDGSLEEKILLERRGFFTDPFSGIEIPLGTKDVLDYINQVIEDKIISKQSQIYSIPIHLRFNKVLFIEKAGFDALLQKSGLVDELGLGIISTQGFGTRAAKKLIAHFIENGVKVYIMNDCDIAGYLIHDKFVSGSNTFSQGLAVEHIGLTVSDIDELGKREQAEVVTYQKPYSNSLEVLTDDEREFFVADPYNHRHRKFRRVEINSLTMPELIEYLRKKIPAEPIAPEMDELEKYINIDQEEIIKEALYRAYQHLNLKEHISTDTKQIAGKVIQTMRNGSKHKHWTHVLNQVKSKVKQEEAEKIVDFIKELNP